MLQQYLPFTVLKLNPLYLLHHQMIVATVLTVYGIETNYGLYVKISLILCVQLQQYLPFTVLKQTY